MGPPSISDDDLIAWWEDTTTHEPLLTVRIDELIRMFLQEGFAEGVRGDAAFCQSLVETGFFRYGGSVQWTQNNFAGLGATGPTVGGASFPDARTGVRAQIQHLRRYADPTCVSPSALRYPLVDPRFNLVQPGRAPLWNQFGFGVWAASTRTNPSYAESILGLFADALAYSERA